LSKPAWPTSLFLASSTTNVPLGKTWTSPVLRKRTSAVSARDGVGGWTSSFSTFTSARDRPLTAVIRRTPSRAPTRSSFEFFLAFGIASNQATAYDPPVAALGVATVTVTFTALPGWTVTCSGTNEIQLAAECGSVPGAANTFGLVSSCHQSQAYARTVTGSLPELNKRIVWADVLPGSSSMSRKAGDAPIDTSAWAGRTAVNSVVALSARARRTTDITDLRPRR
jgi:hypothetical protein